MSPIDEITIRLTRASRISQKCERRLLGRDRGRARERTRRLRAAGALLRERKARRDLQDGYYDKNSDREVGVYRPGHLPARRGVRPHSRSECGRVGGFEPI